MPPACSSRPLKIRRPQLLLLSTRRPRSIIHTRPLPLPHQMLHTTHIMLRLPQVRQLGPSRPLGRPLDDLNSRHIPTIHLKPHLHTHPTQLTPQQNRRLNSPASNTHQHAGKGLGGALGRDHEDVAYAGGVLVVFGKESCAGA